MLDLLLFASDSEEWLHKRARRLHIFTDFSEQALTNSIFCGEALRKSISNLSWPNAMNKDTQTITRHFRFTFQVHN